MDISPPIKPAAVENVSMPIKRGFDIVDLKQYFHVVVKRIWLVALCFVISVSVTVVMLMRQVPVFRTDTQDAVLATRSGLERAREAGLDTVIVDTSGRLQVDEDLMAELAPEMTIIIVTHSMQQAARISDYTAFFLQEVAGEPATLIEYGQTDAIFTSPVDSRTEDYITGRFG